MKVDLSKVLTALVIAALLGAAGAIWDFQNLKAEVKSDKLRQDDRYGLLYSEIVEIKKDVKSILRRGLRERNQ